LRTHDPHPLLTRPAGIRTLYRPEHERDACGTGFVANVDGRREHDVLATALACVRNLTHRGALLDAETGDGAGVLTQVPAGMLRAAVETAGHTLARDSDLGVGTIFLPRDAAGQAAGRALVEAAVARQGLKLFGWRDVPVDSSVLGRNAVASEPAIAQVLVGRPQHGTDDEYERRLFLARKEIEEEALAQRLRLYVPSMSHRTIVYKGLLVAHQLPLYYPDLKDPRYETALAVFHQRYSTNTMPSWELSQPFRMLAHNGEINTLAANKNWMQARGPELAAPDTWGERIEQLQPIVQPGGSDTAALDNALETIVLSGRDVRHALMMLVPEAWENMPNMPEALRAFYEYHACITEPWDGPASLAFSDGIVAGACLDRNGLRPSRYIVTESGRVIAGSEVGMVEVDPATVVEKGRLGPGQMIAV
ncbi:MAG: glutamate synthase subunit alpha, partial [Dehalococcoidia bacterium]